MKYSYKPDRNQADIVKPLREGNFGVHYNVIVTSGIGNGFPDLFIPHNNFNFLFEVKPENAAWILTKAQKQVHPILKSFGQLEIAFNAEQIHNYIQNFQCPYCRRAA